VAGYQDSRISGKRIEDRISELENWKEKGKGKAPPQHRTGGYIKGWKIPPPQGWVKRTKFPPAQDWGLYKSAQE